MARLQIVIVKIKNIHDLHQYDLIRFMEKCNYHLMLPSNPQQLCEVFNESYNLIQIRGVSVQSFCCIRMCLERLQ